VFHAVWPSPPLSRTCVYEIYSIGSVQYKMTSGSSEFPIQVRSVYYLWCKSLKVMSNESDFVDFQLRMTYILHILRYFTTFTGDFDHGLSTPQQVVSSDANEGHSTLRLSPNENFHNS